MTQGHQESRHFERLKSVNFRLVKMTFLDVQIQSFVISLERTRQSVVYLFPRSEESEKALKIHPERVCAPKGLQTQQL